jgi:hypothetical protein
LAYFRRSDERVGLGLCEAIISNGGYGIENIIKRFVFESMSPGDDKYPGFLGLGEGGMRTHGKHTEEYKCYGRKKEIFLHRVNYKFSPA